MKKSIAVILVSGVTLAFAARVAAQAPASPPAPPSPPSPPLPPVVQQFALAEIDDEAPAELESAARQLAASQDALYNNYALLGDKGFRFAGRPGAADGTLVIPKESSDAQGLADMAEDLNVMARILEKSAKAGAGKSASPWYVPSPFGGSASAPRNLYIEGYGALFVLNVNFPLVAPPPPKKEEAETKEENNSEWEVTKRELYAPPGSAFKFKEPHIIAPPGMAAEKYDPEKVETLKKDLIAALKNAAHIRKLKSDETVTVVVSGPGNAVQTKVITSRSPVIDPQTGLPGAAKIDPTTGLPPASKPVPRRATSGVWSTSSSSGGPGPKLVLRAKKSDIDSFQKDKLNFDDFRKKVTLMLLQEP